MDLLIIKELRKKNKLSLRELAKITELSYSYLNLLEEGKRCNPSYHTLQKLATALGVEPNIFFNESLNRYQREINTGGGQEVKPCEEIEVKAVIGEKA